MKLVVETTGPFQVYNPAPEQFANAHRPSVVTPSTFMDIALGAGKLKILGQVSDIATDAELVDYITESGGDTELAVAAFLEAFEDPEAPKPETEAERKKREKAEAKAAAEKAAAEKAEAEKATEKAAG